MKEMSLYIGIFAGVCTAVSLLPQLIKIIREKKADAISYGMLFILLLGLAGWITYGFLKTDWPIIITNSFSFLINALIIIFSIRYKEDKPNQD
jgi:MtN3 and saliva related transmembrane protein